MSKYQGNMVVHRKLNRQERTAVQLPEQKKQSVLEFHAALVKYAPRVAGQRPDRLPYIRSNGETLFQSIGEAQSACKALALACKALSLPVWVEFSPVPNPKGGSPMYQILGYLTGSRKERQSAQEVAFQSL